MELSVKIEPDEDGYTGRECPECEKYFKIRFGTGLPGAVDCHCPYCNHVGPQNEFWTKEQIEYAKSVALNLVSSELLRQMKRLERRPDPRAFMSIGIEVKGSPTPIAYYSEKDLEERVTCSNCTLEYTIYGSFGYCPDCGLHNSQQIVLANFDLVLKVLDLAANATDQIRVKLIENALEDVVSAFDGFGREHCGNLGLRMSFQNIAAARDKLLKDYGLDIAEGLGPGQWSFVCEQFQKRHLLAHTMGIVDEDFVRKTGSSSALLGRKVTITEANVRDLIDALRCVVRTLYSGLTNNHSPS